MAQYYYSLKKMKNDIAKNDRPDILKKIIKKIIRINNRIYERRLKKIYLYIKFRFKKKRGGY